MINTNRIDELREEVGPDDLNEVIELFCEEMEETLSTLDQTALQDLPAQLHFLKGSALNLGLDRVSDLCRAEELRLKSDPTVAPDISAIRQAYSDARQILSSL